MDGMFGQLLAQILGIPRRLSPSEHVEQQWPTIHDKTKLKLRPEDFLSAPVRDEERGLLGMVPRGMLYDLNKQALDRELNSYRFFNAVERTKPRLM